MVNGVVGGALHVPKSMVRLRMLNGATIKIFNIGITKDLLYNHTTNSDSIHFETMYLIATGGGYVDYPRPFTNNLLSLGDRREFIFDFGHYNHGDTLYLTHFDNKLPNDAKYSKHWYSSAMCAFVIDTSIIPTNPVTSLPATLKPYEIAPGPVFKTRVKNLLGEGGSGNLWSIDGTPMIMNVINDTVLVNTKERWVINNTTDHAHPWHIHKVQFQVEEYIGIVGIPDGKGGFTDTPGIYRYADGNLPDELFGWKDVQLIRDAAEMTYVARFDSFPSPYDMPDLFTHGFMYHCHILTHEDNSMMHQFVVVDSLVTISNTDEVENLRTVTLFPNPANNSINFKGDFTDSGVLRFYDLQGKLLDERDMQSLPGSNVPTGHLPRGITIVEYVSGNLRFVEKLVLE